MDENRITYFAETDSRNRRTPFGIKAKDRSRHMYVIGKTGMGKSTLLENMAIQDIQNGEGFAFIDPHGKTADLLLEYIPKERIKDTLIFAPFDTDFPISFNVMEDVGPDKRHLVSNGLMSAFKKIWVDAWSARMEYILNNILLALLEYPDSTLIGVNRMLADKEYRKKVVENITDPSVKAFWTDEFAKYGDRYMQEAGAAIQNKIGQFISNPLIRNIIGQPKSTFDLRRMMDEKKIVIVNLSKGRVGEANANLLGSMLITKIYLSAMSRADTPEATLRKMPDFHLYVDEFQSFANESFADILSEARKYKLTLVVAHQYIEQMSEEVRAAVFGNVGTMITFRVGAYDAEVLEKEFAPTFTAEDLVNLGFIQIYLKLMIDGVSSPPFSARTMPPIKRQEQTFKQEIIEHSRSTYARPRSKVEEDIKKWHEPIRPATISTVAPIVSGRGVQLPSKTPSHSEGKTFTSKLPHYTPKEFTQKPNPFSSISVSPDGSIRQVSRDTRRDIGQPYQNKTENRPQANSKPDITQQSQRMPEKLEIQNRPKRFDVVPPIQPAPVIQNTQKQFAGESAKPKNSFEKSKAPSQENLSELKKALASLVADKDRSLEKSSVKPSAQASPEVVAPKPETKKVTEELKVDKRSANEQKNKPNEIAEDVLRKMLDVG